MSPCLSLTLAEQELLSFPPLLLPTISSCIDCCFSDCQVQFCCDFSFIYFHTSLYFLYWLISFFINIYFVILFLLPHIRYIHPFLLFSFYLYIFDLVLKVPFFVASRALVSLLLISTYSLHIPLLLLSLYTILYSDFPSLYLQVCFLSMCFISKLWFFFVKFPT